MIKQLQDIDVEISYLFGIYNLLRWDIFSGMPKNGAEFRGKVIGYVTQKKCEVITSDKSKEVLEYFKDVQFDNENHYGMYKELKCLYDELSYSNDQQQFEWGRVLGESNAMRYQAFLKKDYSMYEPYVEKIFKIFNEMYDKEKYPSAMDYALSKQDYTLTTEKVDRYFEELKTGVIELLNRIKKSDVKTSSDCADFPIKDKAKFQRVSNKIISKIGYDLDSGANIHMEQPFTARIGPKDARACANYDFFRHALFTVIHETGHAIYSYNSPELEEYGLWGGQMGLQESQSKFYENMIGRTKECLSYFYPYLQEEYEELRGVEFQKFYEACNNVKVSSNRVAADELTFNLHIIIRYEVEKAILSGEVSAHDLRDLWNKKYEEYLGVTPVSDAEGILQDPHWTMGFIGYFPNYSLGNLYSAQFRHKMLEDIPNAYEEIAKGNFDPVNNWLKENIHKYGKIYTAGELIEKLTGEELNVQYYIDYLNEKYGEIYHV